MTQNTDTKHHDLNWLSGGDRDEIEAVIWLQPATTRAGPTSLWLTKFLGRSALQRSLYQLAQSGVGCCAVVGELGNDRVAQELKAQMEGIDTRDMSVCHVDPDSEEIRGYRWAPLLTVVQANFVFDRRLMDAVLDHDTPVALRSSAGTRLGLARLYREDLARLTDDPEPDLRTAGLEGLPELVTDKIPPYVPSMRRSFAPYWQFLDSQEDLKPAGDKVMDSVQKGVLDFPARYLHPIPENLLVRLVVDSPITPNQITVVSAVLAFIGTYWFATQSYLAALLIAVFAGILDGVDGKLARVKLLSSPFGDRLDHSLDVSFEFSWYIAIGWGLYQSSGDQTFFLYGFGLIAIMVAARALSGLYLYQTGHQIHDHTPLDRAVRLFAGRRNIYVLVLFAGYLTGNFEDSFYLIIIWGIVTVAIYSIRNAMVFAQNLRLRES